MKGKLIRERDGLVKEGDIKFVEFSEEGYGQELHDAPKVGYSIIVGWNRLSYTWLTTTITEIIGENKFKTKNSIYTIEYDSR